MQATHRRILIAAVAGLQLVLAAALLVWRVEVWSGRGWGGLAFLPASDLSAADPDTLEAFEVLRQASGAVLFVAPDSAAQRAGLEIGDVIVAVDGVEAVDFAALRRLAAVKRRGEVVTYRVQTRQGERSIGVTLESPFTRLETVFGMASSLAVGLVFLAISLLVAWGRPRSASALVFYLMCAAGSALFFVWSASELDVPNLRGVAPFGTDLHMWVIYGSYVLLALVMTNLLFHLSLIFPRTRPVVRRWPAVFRWLHSVPFLPLVMLPVWVGALLASKSSAGLAMLELGCGALAAGLAVHLLRRARREGWKPALASHPLALQLLLLALGSMAAPALRLLPRPVYVGTVVAGAWGTILFWLGILFLYSILTCGAFYRSYREATLEEKRQVAWPLWGSIVAVGGATLLSAVTLTLVSVDRHPGPALTAGLTLASKLFYLLIPASFAVGILKYRLMEIDVIIRKTLVYAGVTGFVVAAYLLLVGTVGLALVSYVDVESQAVTVVATLAVATLLVPVKNRIQRFVDRRFSRRADVDELRREIARQALAATDPIAFSRRLAEQLQQALQCRSVVVFSRAPRDERLLPAAKVGLPDEVLPALALAAAALPAAGGRVLPAAALAEPPPAWRRFAAERLVRAELHGELVGLVAVGRKLSRGAYDADDEAFLIAVADQLAMVVGNLRLRRDESEVAQALEIQRSLLPERLPQRPGLSLAAHWQPAREVGGDYYDALDLEGSDLALCIGDVVGKGMPAALFMSSLQAAVKALAPQGKAPAEVCTEVRQVVCQNLTGGKFVTFFYGRLELGGKLLYTNAGHNPPIVARADGSIVRLEEGGGAMARLLAEAPYRQGQLELRPGDRLLLFTDGVSEARDGAGGQLGEERLIELLQSYRELDAEQLCEQLVAAVEDFTGGEPQDDVTLLVAAVEA